MPGEHIIDFEPYPEQSAEYTFATPEELAVHGVSLVYLVGDAGYQKPVSYEANLAGWAHLETALYTAEPDRIEDAYTAFDKTGFSDESSLTNNNVMRAAVGWAFGEAFRARATGETPDGPVYEQVTQRLGVLLDSMPDPSQLDSGMRGQYGNIVGGKAELIALMAMTRQPMPGQSIYGASPREESSRFSGVSHDAYLLDAAGAKTPISIKLANMAKGWQDERLSTILVRPAIEETLGEHLPQTYEDLSQPNGKGQVPPIARYLRVTAELLSSESRGEPLTPEQSRFLDALTGNIYTQALDTSY